MMVRPHVAAAAILILLAACTHDSSGSRATTAQTAAQGATSAPPAAQPAPGVEPHQRQSDAGTPAVATQPAASQTNPASAAPATPTASATATAPATATAQPTPTAPAAPSQTGAAAAKAGPSRQAATPPPRPTSPAPAAATAAAAASAPSPAPVVTAAPLDLDGLEQRLRNTRAIGLFTKLSLKNQVDDLLGQFKAFHQGQSQTTLGQLRQKYELLLMKVVSLLQDGDPGLANAILASREAIWGVLTDPQKFAAIGNSMRS